MRCHSKSSRLTVQALLSDYHICYCCFILTIFFYNPHLEHLAEVLKLGLNKSLKRGFEKIDKFSIGSKTLTVLVASQHYQSFSLFYLRPEFFNET